MGNREEINLEALESVNGGAIGFDPEPSGTYTMRCQFTGKVYTGVSLSQVMEIAKYGATVPNTLEGEQQILNWAANQGII